MRCTVPTRFALWLGIAVVFFAGSVAAADDSPAKRIVVVAHRGAHLEHPENSLPSFAAAAEMGCDYVEVDVRQTRDGALVLMHDSSVDRTTNGHGKVADLTLAEIKALEMRAPGDKYPEPLRVPTFEEALTAIAGKVNLYLDHKSAPEDVVVKMLREHEMIPHTAVYSSPRDLARFHSLAPSLRLMPPHPDNDDQMRAWREDFGANIFDGGVDEWTAPGVALAHKLGAEVWVDCLGDQDNPRGWRRAVAIGVDGIQTNRPAELIELLDNLGLR